LRQAYDYWQDQPGYYKHTEHAGRPKATPSHPVYCSSTIYDFVDMYFWDPWRAPSGNEAAH